MTEPREAAPLRPEVLLPVSDAVRVSAQKALWNAITECGGTPTPDMVRRGRTVVEECLATALTQAPRSCCAEVSATDTEAMRLLADIRACRVAGRRVEGIHGSVDLGEGWNIGRLTALLPRIDALAKGGA